MADRMADRPRPDTPPTILVVDDEPDILESILDVLQSSLHRAHVITAGTAEEGLRILDRTSNDVHLVISDYRLPGMDGIAFLREARRRVPHAPRFLITAYTEVEVPEADLDDAGIEGVVTKPLDADQFLAWMEAALLRPYLAQVSVA